MIVELDNQRVLEVYRSGWDSTFGSGGIVIPSWRHFDEITLHDMRSTSKSIVALLAGIVLAKHGGISSDPSINDYPEIRDRAASWAGDITLRNLLGMTSGLEWNEWGRGFLTSDETPLSSEPDPVARVLNKPMVSPQGDVFNYSGGATVVAARMLELLDGRDLTTIAKEELFDQIGIASWEWPRGSNGKIQPHVGLRMKASDMAKIGELMLSGGSWEGHQIIPEEWVRQVTALRVKTTVSLLDLDGGESYYGLGWWTGKVQIGSQNLSWFSTLGNGGQRIFVMPLLRLVVVFTGGEYGSGKIQARETLIIRDLVQDLSNR